MLFWDDKLFLNVLVLVYDFLMIKKYCGVKKEKGKYFGFFVSVGVVNWMLS